MAETSGVRDIAREAENVIVRLAKEGNGRLFLTTSQIRKFLAAVNALTNKITVYRAQNDGATALTEALASEVKYLKVKLAYQVGRNPRAVRPFVETARLTEWIDGIGTNIRAYEDFAHYMEALVAYHKFYGGQD